MANENMMIQFLKGAVANLPATATPGAVYFTKDEGLYLGLEDGSFHRYGDFIIVNDVASLPASGAHETCAYYCVSENILARFDKSTNTWTQINKQKTLAELGGVAQSAYDEKMLALEQADSDNADAISGVDERLQAAEEKLKSVATTDGLGELTDRVTTAEGEIDVLQTASHTHTFADSDVEDAISKKHTHTFADADVVDAITKKHSHTFVETELNKIVDGDVAKWNTVAADYLDSEDKTALENSIKEAKKAGTDANTNIEAYKVTNDARVLAVEEDIAEITGDNGILAQAKSYVDGKDSAMNTRVLALETAAPTHALKTEVEAVDAKFANYNTTVAQKAIDDAQDAEIAKKVNKTDYEADKATFATKTDIEKLAGVSTGANKVEKSDTNGNIKIDGVETVVYTHPEKHAIADVTGLQDALDGLQAKGDYAVEGHKHVKADITDFAHTHVAVDITDLDDTIKGYDYATKTEAQGYANAKDEAIAAAKKAGDDAQKTADDITAYVGTFTASEGIDTVVKYIDAKTANIASDERVNGIDERLTQAEKDIDALETESAKHAIKTEVEGALALKADKSVVDAMYTNAQIDSFIAEAKKYADDNDADTKYGIVYDSDNKKIKLVEGGTDVEIDASAFIKDGMISNVTIGNDNDLVITFNTDAGKENIVLPLDQLVDIYTGVEGDRIKVTVNADKSITADLVAGSIGKDYLDDGVKASLALADSALQEHQDISHLATKDELASAKTEAANQDTVVLAEAQKYADTAKADAEAKAAELDAALKSELQGEIDADVKVVSDALAQYKIDNNAAVALKANTADVYAKTETYTKAEVEALLTWGSF